MSSKVHNARAELTGTQAAKLDVLGDQSARTILIATSEEPRTAKELTDRAECSSATVYRRINNLLESELLEECIRFDEDGSHTTAYKSTIDSLHVEIDSDGIDVLATQLEQ